MIYTAGSRCNREVLAYMLDVADGAPEKLDLRADLRQDSEMGFQAPTESGRLYSSALGNARRLPPG